MDQQENKSTSRARAISARTYHRPVGGRLETWPEVVSRVLSHQKWLWERAKGDVLTEEESDEIIELGNLILARKIMPAGRTLWLGGTDISKKRESSMFNCFSGDTLYMTEEGLKSFKDTEGTCQQVLAGDGKWRSAKVRKYGKQDLYKVTLKGSAGRTNHRISFMVTKDHKWTTSNRGTITNLCKGDRIPFNSAPCEDNLEQYTKGFIFGDGTFYNKKKSRVRLCGSKNSVSLLEPEKIYSSPSLEGDVIYQYPESFGNGKVLPKVPSAAWLEGLLEADGYVNTLSSSEEGLYESLSSNSGYTGKKVSGINISDNITNYGTRKYPLHKISFNNTDYVVERIEFSHTDNVYCVEEPVTGHFTLEHGVLTGNCAFTYVETIYDMVDVLWLLLQGCGVGFKPVTGTLRGYAHSLKSVRLLRSTRTDKGGQETNSCEFDDLTKTYTITIGDCAVSWAKALGKLVKGHPHAEHLVIDLTQLRPSGERLKGYGWISAGDGPIAVAFEKIAHIMSGKADQLLTKMDILDVVNHLGTILSTRRSAEIALFDFGDREWVDFATAKKDFWEHGNEHRQMSNNSLLFNVRPTKEQIQEVFDIMVESGGSEPGMVNAVEAKRRAPWFKGCNPCVEILLGNKSFCNLTEINLLAFKDDKTGLERALYLAARMNYRQTMVNLQDEVLQESWHLNNEFLHLCGVGLTGIAGRDDITPYEYKRMKNIAVGAAYGMARELDSPLPKNVTTVKPSGTLSKIMGTEQWGEVPEGIHKPMGRYMFTNVSFSRDDPLVQKFRDANYDVIYKPHDNTAVLIKFPVRFDNIEFDKVNGVEVNLESAIDQLERYKMIMENWCEQNVSNTISYSVEEVPEIVDWLHNNWDSYVGVSFLFRTDPTKTAEDLGYKYLPQEVTTREKYTNYILKLSDVDLDIISSKSLDDNLDDEECKGGACPIR